MHKKLSGYFLISFLSFCAFTLLFHAAAHAQSGEFLSPEIQAAPSPTIYMQQQPKINKPQVVTDKIAQTLPTPTIYIAPVKPATVTPTPTEPVETPIPTVKAQPTIAEPTTTPVPTETPVPTLQSITTAPTDLDSLFTKYANEFGVDNELLKKIAKCESGFNPTSNNSDMYLGMYQFSSSTWSVNRNRMGLDPNPDLRTNAEEAIRTAAFVISRGGRNAWPNCN